MNSNLNKLLVTALCCFACAAYAAAAEYDGFYAAAGENLKPFARDLGGLLGSGANQTARSLGFSGFDIGVRASAQLKPGRKNPLLRKNSVFGLGLVQAEIGMPYRIDGFVRGGSYEGLTVAGFGLRYGLWNISDDKYRVNAMLVAMTNLATHRYFNALHFNSSVVCSINVPVVTPFVGVGLDSTRLTAQGVADPALAGRQVSTLEARYIGGLRFKFDLGYFTAGVTYTHERPVLSASTGIRF